MTRPADQGSAEGAAHPELVTIGTPMLRQPTTRITDFDGARALCERLVYLLAEINGAGLAANQIGAWQRAMVFQVRKTELHPDRPETPLYVMINPDIIEMSEETVDGWEGCFSVPGYMGLVPRATRLKCRWDSVDGEEHIQEFEGWAARVIQHECDHLDGKVYIDRMKSMLNFSTQPNYKEFHMPKPSTVLDASADHSTTPGTASGANADHSAIPGTSSSASANPSAIPSAPTEQEKH
ncbi:MAG: peptide deformylase [Candidatus Melainabacteria bacterium]|nr:MAG: peptide deformylase [Candidatus Melainabacteria bacterium]